jgi:hypothetical protein
MITVHCGRRERRTNENSTVLVGTRRPDEARLETTSCRVHVSGVKVDAFEARPVDWPTHALGQI